MERAFIWPLDGPPKSWLHRHHQQKPEEGQRVGAVAVAGRAIAIAGEANETNRSSADIQFPIPINLLLIRRLQSKLMK